MIRATLDLRSFEGPLTNDGRTLDDLFLLDADISGTLRNRSESLELSGKWRVIARRLEFGLDGECNSYSLERLP